MASSNNDIRAKEDALFIRWRKKYEEASFVIDGCPNPEVYFWEEPRVVFVLKDGNLGVPHPGDSSVDRVYDQRYELEFEPTPWWDTVAIWSHFLRNPSLSWRDGQDAIKCRFSIRDSLSHNCVVQIKKTWGKGAVSNKELLDVAISDRGEIVEQLSIYQPDFIVACGNGECLSFVLGCNPEGRQETSFGVGFWELDLFDRSCYLIDYCHPSIRVGTKVRGLIGKGLSSALLEIKNGS